MFLLHDRDLCSTDLGLVCDTLSCYCRHSHSRYACRLNEQYFNTLYKNGILHLSSLELQELDDKSNSLLLMSEVGREWPLTLHVHVFPDLTRKRFLPTHRVSVNCLLFFRTSRCGSISVGKTFRGCCSHRNPYCFPVIHLMGLSSHPVKTSIFFLQIYGEKI